MRGIAKVAMAVAIGLGGFAGLPAIAQTSDQTSSVQSLTDAGLKTLLDGLGYETQALNKGFLITFKQDTWSLYVQLVLSADGTKLGLNANLGKVDDLSAVPAKKWLELLVANGKIDPSTFYVNEESKELFLHRVVDNRGITPAILRVQIENFCNNIMDNADTWDLTQ